MSNDKEPITIGLTESAHAKLQNLKQDGYFSEMTDGYRFAIALALAHGVTPSIAPGGRTTFLNVGSLDPDQSLYVAVSTLRDPSTEPVYRTAEKLAEWGVEELARRSEAGTLSISDVLREADDLLGDKTPADIVP